jgi:hypothetical protein
MSVFSIPFARDIQMLWLFASGFERWYLNCETWGVPPPGVFAFELQNPSTFFRPRRNGTSALYAGRDLERGDCEGLVPVRRLRPASCAISASPEESLPAATPGQGEG